jgi:mRNA interferase RelE/StbE
LTPSAKRDLDKLGEEVYERIFRILNRLSLEPRPKDCKKLVGGDKEYRIRVGKYRILYEIFDIDSKIEIHRVLPRDKAYK